MKGTFSQFSKTKANIIASIKNNNSNSLSLKVKFATISDKTDIRFFPEVLTVSTFLKTSPNIALITMNSENSSTATIISKGTNKYPDITLNIHNNIINRDIKSSDNMDKPFSGVLA